MTIAVTLDNVTAGYERRPAIHHVSGTFAAGSLTAVAGSNGAGKSTLLKAIAGILPVQEGRIHIADGDTNAIAYLPQASRVRRDFPLSVLHLVATGFWARAGGSGAITAAMRERAAQALAETGLSGWEKRALSALSAGQFQRALFARLLVQDAGLMVLDEPFTAMDESAAAHLLEIVRRWHREKRTVICALHDFEQIRAHFPQCLLLARECVAWGDSTQALCQDNLLSARFFRENPASPPTLCERAV